MLNSKHQMKMLEASIFKSCALFGVDTTEANVYFARKQRDWYISINNPPAKEWKKREEKKVPPNKKV